MNESFDIKRFNALFMRYWAEQKKVLLLSSTLFVFTMLAYFIYHQNNTGNIFERSFLDFIATVAFFMYMFIQLNLVFVELINKKKSVQLLLLPVTAIEKYAFLLIFGYLIPIALYFVAVLILNYFHTYLLGSLSPDYFWDMSNIWFAVRTFYFVPFLYLLWFSGFLIFKKFHTLYSTISFAIIFLLLVIVENFITKMYTNDAYIFSVSPFYKLNVQVYTSHLQIDNGLLIDSFGGWTVLVIIVGIIAFAANFYKFKEKEL